MATERQRQVALGAVLVVLVVVLYRAAVSLGTTSGVPASPSSLRTRTDTAGDAAATAPEVYLWALGDERPKPVESERNLFRFRPKPPAPPPQGATPVVRTVPGAPPGPRSLAPIPLTFIGIVEAPETAKRIVALIDTTGHAYHGTKGAVVAGQYRIVKIGVESIEMTYLDGRGQQTIRLSGS